MQHQIAPSRRRLEFLVEARAVALQGTLERFRALRAPHRVGLRRLQLASRPAGRVVVLGFHAAGWGRRLSGRLLEDVVRFLAQVAVLDHIAPSRRRLEAKRIEGSFPLRTPHRVGLRRLRGRIPRPVNRRVPNTPSAAARHRRLAGRFFVDVVRIHVTDPLHPAPSCRRCEGA